MRCKVNCRSRKCGPQVALRRMGGVGGTFLRRYLRTRVTCCAAVLAATAPRARAPHLAASVALARSARHFRRPRPARLRPRPP
eukprot:1351287-Prymnesium_polylepis.1